MDSVVIEPAENKHRGPNMQNPYQTPRCMHNYIHSNNTQS